MDWFENFQKKFSHCTEVTTLDIKVGDIVAVLGKIFTVKFFGNEYHITRGEDVIAYCR